MFASPSGPFSFTSNAFYVLGADYNSTPAEIADLVEDAQFSSSVPEDELHKAQQTLLTPKLRMAAELSWLPELSSAQIEKLTKGQQLSEAEVATHAKNLPELARCNVVADLCGRQAVSRGAIKALLSSWETLDADEVLRFISGKRKSAGLPQPDAKLFRTCLDELKNQHAIAAMGSLLKLDDAVMSVKAVVEHEIAREHPSSLLPLLAREYEKVHERDFARINEEVTDLLTKVKEEPGHMTGHAVALRKPVTELGHIRTPLTKFYEWRGLPEPRSKTVFQNIREVLLHLTNEDGNLDGAKSLLWVQQVLFSDVPELKAIADKDSADLEDLIKQKYVFELFTPLHQSMEASKVAYREFARVTKVAGLVSNSPDPVGKFIGAMDTFVKSDADVDIAAKVARELSLSFNNDHNDPGLAYQVLEWATQRTKGRLSSEMQALFDEDAATLYRNWKWGELNKQLNNVSHAITIAEEASKNGPPAVATEFATLLPALYRKRKGQRFRSLVWGGGALLILVLILAAATEDKKRSTYSTSTYTPQTSTPNVTTTKTKTVPPIEAEPVSYEETKPSVGRNQSLNRSEIRYCIFQGKRLDAARTLAQTNTAIDRFNVLVNDFNSRCGSFRYGQNDMDAVNRETADSNLIRIQARDLLENAR